MSSRDLGSHSSSHTNVIGNIDDYPDGNIMEEVGGNDARFVTQSFGLQDKDSVAFVPATQTDKEEQSALELSSNLASGLVIDTTEGAGNIAEVDTFTSVPSKPQKRPARQKASEFLKMNK